MPQPAQQHRRHQVCLAPHLAAPVAPQGDIDGVAQESAQADMPSTPEVGDVGRLVGAEKVHRKPDVEHPRQSDRHVGVSGKVEIDLQRIGQRRVPGLKQAERRTPRDGVEADIGEPPKHVRQHQLLGQAEQKECASHDQVLPVRPRQPGCRELRQDLA